MSQNKELIEIDTSTTDFINKIRYLSALQSSFLDKINLIFWNFCPYMLTNVRFFKLDKSIKVSYHILSAQRFRT